MTDKYKFINAPHFYNLSHYVSYGGMEAEQLYNLINEHDSILVEIIEPLFRYNAYGIILPVQLIIPYYFDKETITWWNSIINELDMNQSVFRMVAYMEKTLLSENAEAVKLFGIQYSLLSLCGAELEECVWTVCEKFCKRQDLLQCCTNMSRFYSEDVSGPLFWKDMVNFVVPDLLNTVSAVKNNVFSTKWEKALIKKCVNRYSSEFGLLCHRISERLKCGILKEGITKFSSVDLKRVLQDTNETEELVLNLDLFAKAMNLLEELVSIDFQYAVKNYNHLRICLPLLLQVSGQYDKAFRVLQTLIHEREIREVTDDRVWIALYIATLTVESEEKKIQAYDILRRLFENDAAITELEQIQSDIILFYRGFGKELAMRFSPDLLPLLEKKCSWFYGAYKYYIEKDYFSDYDVWFGKDAAYIIWKMLFQNNKVNSVLKKICCSGIAETFSEDEKNTVNLANCIQNSYLFSALFHSLASHLDTRPRMLINEVIDYVNAFFPEDKLSTYSKSEWFDVYSPEQIAELQELERRLDKAMDNIPRLSAVYLNQGAFGNQLRRRWFELADELSKQSIASDYLRLYTIE